MAEKNEVAKKPEFTTGLSQWTNTITGLVSRDFEQNGVQYDEYSKQCAMNAMASSSLLQLDETYKASQEEIAQNENSQEFVVEDEAVVAESEAVEVETPEFAKE